MRTCTCQRASFALISVCSLVLLFAAPSAAEHSCVQREKHASLTFFLVDKSDKLTDTANLKQTLVAIKEMIKPGERLIVGLISGTLKESRVIFDLVRPENSLWASKLKIRAQERNFSECFAEMEQAVLLQSESSERSAILETFAFIHDVLASDSGSPKRIVLFSDMLQNTDSLSFYGAQPVNADAALQKAKSESLVYDLKGVEVYAAGTGGGSSEKKDRQIKAFWEKYFTQSGAALRFYGPVLLGEAG